MTLVSPGVEVNIIDQSFNIPGQASSVPVIIIATADEKLNTLGDPALGTFEFGVIRTVTTISQSLQLYGIPKFYESSDGLPLHGDVRNEYGLDALNKYLELGNRAYVLRANVNLNDNYNDIVDLWDKKIDDASDVLRTAVVDYINQFNAMNGFLPTDTDFKVTVTKTELKSLVDDVLLPVLSSYSFSSTDFKNGYLQDHTIDHAGFQDVIYDSTAGFIQADDATGLENDGTVYGFEVRLVSINGSNLFQISVTGANAQTFAQLVTVLQAEIQNASGSGSTVELIQGRIRITSDLLGATSAVEIENDGFTGVTPLFASTNLFSKFDEPVQGQGISSLNVYNNDFTVINGSYDGLRGIIDNWSTGSVNSNEFTADEAAGILVSSASTYEHTKEFKNFSSLGANDAARRIEVVTALQAAINDPNNGLRAENLEYNVLVCPGFPEVTDELLRLSQDLNQEVFVIGDTPIDKPPTGPNSIVEWAGTPARVTSPDVAYYYPHAITSNIDGKNIVTTAAALALRIFAFNDSQAPVWFAPAGTQRGQVPEANVIGYVSGVLGTPTTFVTDFIDQGTRDILYEFPKNINPISFIPGRGILAMGQKTTNPVTSSLSSVNVSRLVKFIKRELRKGLFAFLFEPNDKQTRDDIKAVTTSFLSDLVQRRALFDFAVVVDETNNTPQTIDANEVRVDIALKPVKAVEFIIATVTLVNTGDDIGGRVTTP